MSNDAEQSELDPTTAYALTDQARRDTSRALAPNLVWMYAMWGTAWLIGFGSFHGASHGWLPISYGVAATIFAISIAAGIVVSAVLGIRSGSGVRGPGAFQGAVYGWSWMLGFATVFVLAARIGSLDLDYELTGMLINSIAILVVGLMYAAGAALWHDYSMLVLAIWFTVVNIVSLIAGPSHYLLVFMTLGVAGFYVAAIAEWVRGHRQAR